MAGTLSLIHSYDLNMTLFECWGWIFTGLIFYLFINTIDEEKDAESFFIWAGAVLMPLVLWNHRPLVNANVLAGFTLYWLLFFWIKTSEKRSYGIVLLSGLCLLAMTRSVWAFICLFLGTLLYYREGALMASKRHKWTFLIVASAVLGLLFLAIDYRLTHQSLSSAAPGTNRLYYWLAAVRMWRHNFWTGVGLGGYATAYPFFRAGPAEGTLFAHGWPFQWIAETGAFGIVALIWFVIKYGRLRQKPGLLVFDATLFTVLLYSLVNINMDFLLNKLMFMIFLATTLQRHKFSMYRARPLWLSTAAGVTLLIGPLWFCLFQASRLATAGLQYEQSGNLDRAKRCYGNAITLNPFEANGYWGLARIYRNDFEKRHSSESGNAALRYFKLAAQYRKDVRIDSDYKNLIRELHIS